MKFIQFATITTLSTMMLAGGATSTFAAETRSVTTDGQITFTPNTDDELVVVPPETGPEAPDVEIPPQVPGTTGPLSIMKAPTMNFGSQVISNQDQTYEMVAEMQKLANPVEGGPTEVPYVSFAQVQDVRGTNAGWDLQVRLSNFTSSTQNNVLTGAEVSLASPRIQYEGNTPGNAPVAHADGLKLMPNASAVSVMRAEKEKGAGVSSVVWGNQADLNRQATDENIDVVKNNAIQLSVPGATAKDATTYQSTLSWELTTLPDEDAGETPDTI